MLIPKNLFRRKVCLHFATVSSEYVKVTHFSCFLHRHGRCHNQIRRNNSQAKRRNLHSDESNISQLTCIFPILGSCVSILLGNLSICLRLSRIIYEDLKAKKKITQNSISSMPISLPHMKKFPNVTQPFTIYVGDRNI